MVTINWSQERGWYGASVKPYQPIALDPANLTLQYAQTIFEGLKVYRQPDGSVAAFRPEENARRFKASARRMAMPELPTRLFMKSVDALVALDLPWVPQGEGQSLYLRPFMIADEAGLRVRPASSYLFVVIASPTDKYFTGPVRPVSVWVSEEYVRAAPGGTGAAKTGANYAASLLGQAQATENGCDQVVWLDAVERRWVEEMGAMNLYFVYRDGRLVTPALSGALLPGITRDSLLALALDLGGLVTEVAEERVSVQQWRADAESGALTEVFACGTAAGITPVGEVRSASGSWRAGDVSEPMGPVTARLHAYLSGVQNGTIADSRGWMRPLGVNGPPALSWPAADHTALLGRPLPY
ncbi:branched-chain amino acid aminotransferase [Streptomyces sp. NPDC020800]|uniref:branched-chain amino acid aminotransferase n=1 Tax=Streptomyces sp. NPDC020800 TaxID=3365092 RepID=UPI0037A2F170